MSTNRYERQSFLGEKSQHLFGTANIAVIGLGGGGSHIVQQCAHVGFQNFLDFDPDVIEDTNLNRLIGGTARDVAAATPKIEIAERIIKGLQPDAKVDSYQSRWQEHAAALKTSDLIFSAVDSYQERHEIEVFSRRYMIPMIDMGMEVREDSEGSFSMFGQVILSLPGSPCMRCMGFLTDEKLSQEARRYGDVGSVPQVVWANGVLASIAVGLSIELLTNWTKAKLPPLFLTYDGKRCIVQPRPIVALVGDTCQHFPLENVGDPIFRSL